MLSTIAQFSPIDSAAFATEKVIRAVMHSDLRVLDPLFTTAYITRDHGYMVYDTLLATDSNFQIQPQMADWTVSDDRLTYTFRLRDGLKWHDGGPVTAEDCIASLNRWARSDAMGQKLMEYTASLEAADARTIILKLKQPYGLVLESIGKPSSFTPFMMPKRLAETPAGQQMAEQVGSGPFKFVQSEFQPGVKAVYVKNDDYVPRKEAPSWTAGGKVVKVDRVEWLTMPDAQTAVNALQSGEIDVLEVPPLDLLPMLESNPELTQGVLNKSGLQAQMRMNFLIPPFDNVKVRRAALLALNQKDVLDAVVGNPDYYRICGAVFGCGTPLETDAGAESLVKGNGMAEAKKQLAASGYDGTPIVMLAASDNLSVRSQPLVVSQLLREAGFKVDVQTCDWQTVVMRRASQKPLKEGGWNIFFTNWVVSDLVNPVINASIAGRGTKGGWFGWPTDPEMERLRDAFARATSPEEQRRIAVEVQRENFDQVIAIPLGQFALPSAWRKSITGLLDGPTAPTFWNVSTGER
ncbi:ABC transporter substrate-binding protein [Bradyrhizobium sp. BR 10289]|uniref:ABC transporter substrate-binding protein n=1 Tax=Bradyrhizobium sp. BR 10289 TaxID=2749993 RepID=UPI001E3848A6|nr:ABC transporter substrate-binding protein [Bradyrhizobium sp. BR 10289]